MIHKTRDFFNPDSTRQYIAQVTSIFNGITIERYSKQGGIKQELVPVQFYGTKMFEYRTMKQDSNVTGNTRAKTVPIIGITYNGMDANNELNRYRAGRTNHNLDFDVMGNRHITFEFTPRAYIFKFGITIKTKSLEDMSSIETQIASTFKPNYNLRIKDNIYTDRFTDVYLTKTDFQLSQPDELTDIEKIYTVDFDVYLYGWLYDTLSKSSIIEKIYLYFNDLDTEAIASIQRDVLVYLTDKASESEYEDFDLEPEKRNPKFIAIEGDKLIQEKTKHIYRANVKDLDGIDKLTYAWSVSGNTVLFTDKKDGTIEVTASEGNLVISCEATDERGAKTQATKSVLVKGENTPIKDPIYINTPIDTPTSPLPDSGGVKPPID